MSYFIEHRCSHLTSKGLRGLLAEVLTANAEVVSEMVANARGRTSNRTDRDVTPED